MHKKVKRYHERSFMKQWKCMFSNAKMRHDSYQFWWKFKYSDANLHMYTYTRAYLYHGRQAHSARARRGVCKPESMGLCRAPKMCPHRQEQVCFCLSPSNVSEFPRYLYEFLPRKVINCEHIWDQVCMHVSMHVCGEESCIYVFMCVWAWSCMYVYVHACVWARPRSMRTTTQQNAYMHAQMHMHIYVCRT